MGRAGKAASLRPLTSDEEAFLRAFARALMVVPRALDADLLHEQRLPQSEYFVLMHLSEAPDRKLRMSELAAAAALSLSGMTRIVSKLESDGLVRRERCVADSRGWHAVLTDAGLVRLREAWPTHLASVRRHVFGPLEGVDLADLTAALARMGDTSSEEAPPGCTEASPMPRRR